MAQNKLKLKSDKFELHEQIEEHNKDLYAFAKELNTACNEIAHLNKFVSTMAKGTNNLDVTLKTQNRDKT